MPVLSIITAIHNGLPFNQIFFESLRRYTKSSFELVIIDNASTDGSREYFIEKGATVIHNAENLSYPVCQNQGIRRAKGDIYCFLNNDLVLSPGWDSILIQAMETHRLDIISASGIENVGNAAETRSLHRKWKRSKNILMALGFGKRNLKLMHRVMYGSWEKFCEKRFKRYGLQVAEGIVGNNVIMSKRGVELAGLWDERIQSADFDLFMRAKKRSLEAGDLKAPHIALGAFIHHYSRMTSKYAVEPRPFADIEKHILLSDKWTESERDELHPDNSTIRKR